MKLTWILMACLSMCAPAVSQAYTTTVICDACGEAEYSKSALRAAEGADHVLVIDGANAQLRKYRVSRSGDRELTRYRTTVSRIEPSRKEWSDFEEMVRIYDTIRFHLESCGPGEMGDYLVPDMNVSWACEQHDACYAAGGTSDDRARCDQQFYNDMIALGTHYTLATAYYLAVRAAGWMYFNYTSINASSIWGNPSGCAYFEICDYTDIVAMPR